MGYALFEDGVGDSYLVSGLGRDEPPVIFLVDQSSVFHLLAEVEQTEAWSAEELVVPLGCLVATVDPHDVLQLEPTTAHGDDLSTVIPIMHV